MLENRLTQLISRLSLPGPGETAADLDKEYREILERIRRLKQGNVS